MVRFKLLFKTNFGEISNIITKYSKGKLSDLVTEEEISHQDDQLFQHSFSISMKDPYLTTIFIRNHNNGFSKYVECVSFMLSPTRYKNKTISYIRKR